MLTRALLMCSDAKALEAVSQILGELEISFETISDPALAAKRLANQRFDPILVDCDNVTNATLVLESARKSSANQSSMTIAIVDGKAGVPIAFRLGARLVMTKPVSLEGARSTLRNALAMQRKEAHDGKASAAAAVQGTATIAPIQDASLGPATPPAAHSLPGADNPKVRSSVTAKIGSASAAVKAPGSTETATNVVPLSLSRTEHGSIEIDDSTATQWAEHKSPRRSAPSPSRRKTSPYLLTAIIMLLVAAGFYAAFMMLPAFHDVALSQYESLHTLITGTPAKAPTGASPRPAPAPAQPATAQTTAPGSAQPLNAAAATAASSTSSNKIADGFAPAQAAPTQGFKGDDTKTKAAASVLPTSATAPKGNNGGGPVVVAEDIADSHVSYRVRPVYPYVARRKGVEGAVVLLASVNSDGTVDSVRVISGNPQLAPSAVEAVKQWRYEPYYANGQPVFFQAQVTVRFQASSH